MEVNMNLRLSDKYGLSPHMTTCSLCGKDGDDIILTGNQHKYKHHCGQIFIGRLDKNNTTCPKCGLSVRHGFDLTDLGEPPPEEKLPSIC